MAFPVCRFSPGCLAIQVAIYVIGYTRGRRTKSDNGMDFRRTRHTAFSGDTYYHFDSDRHLPGNPSIAGKVMEQVSSNQTQPATLITSKLTVREIEVLRLIAKGLSNADISERLFLSEGTVRNHVSAILAKLDVSDRTQAAVIAIQHGLN